MLYPFLFSLMCFGLHAAPPPNDRNAHIQIYEKVGGRYPRTDTWEFWSSIDSKPDVIRPDGIGGIMKIEHLSGKSGCSYKTPQGQEILFMWMNGVDVAVHENPYPEEFGRVASVTCKPYENHVRVTIASARGDWGGDVFLDLKDRYVGPLQGVHTITQGGDGALCIYKHADGKEALRIRTENHHAATQRGSFSDVKWVNCQPLDA